MSGVNTRANDPTKNGDPEKEKRRKLYWKWWATCHIERLHAFASALDLQRDPERAYTHIIVRRIEFVSESQELRYAFRDVACEAYKLDDILPDVEVVLGSDEGKGREQFDSVIRDTDKGRGEIPMVFLTVVDDLVTWVGGGEFQLGFPLSHIKAFCSRTL